MPCKFPISTYAITSICSPPSAVFGAANPNLQTLESLDLRNEGMEESSCLIRQLPFVTPQKLVTDPSPGLAYDSMYWTLCDRIDDSCSGTCFHSPVSLAPRYWSGLQPSPLTIPACFGAARQDYGQYYTHSPAGALLDMPILLAIHMHVETSDSMGITYSAPEIQESGEACRLTNLHSKNAPSCASPAIFFIRSLFHKIHLEARHETWISHPTQALLFAAACVPAHSALWRRQWRRWHSRP